MSAWKKIVRSKFIAVFFLMTFSGSVLMPPRIRADEPKIGDQIAGDLVGAGVSLAAALSGNVPLAFLAGYLTKYIATYGIAGVKALIDFFKGYRPQDLGEINLYYVYLLNVKRNLYSTLIQIRRSVQADQSLANLESELSRIQKVLSEECKLANGCSPTGLDYSLVNYQMINILLDAKSSIDISKHLGAQEIKNTYQYLILLYLDVVLVEQKLIEAQYNVLANTIAETYEELEENEYISNEEKEFQSQLLISTALRWLKMADTRRVIVSRAIENPLKDLKKENSEIEKELEDYKKRYGFLAMGFDSVDSSADSSYDDYMKKVASDMRDAGMQVDVFGQNPFQTGTSLSGYYLAEKTLLLERDAFFQMKSNKLQTTEEVADFQHRLQVLRSHGNNILLQLIQSVEQRNKDGFTSIEQPQQKVEIDKLIEECKKDSQCVADRLKNRETSLKNILLDNFALATQVFTQIPHMHALEVNSIYQLVQLIYLEVFHSQAKLSRVEFDIFISKMRNTNETIQENRNLTEKERQLHQEMTKNTVNKWKKRILERRYDAKDEFRRQALAVNNSNQSLYKELADLRTKNAEVFGDYYTKDESCFSWFNFRQHQWCQNKKKLVKKIEEAAKSQFTFLNQKEIKLPGDFWKEL